MRTSNRGECMPYRLGMVLAGFLLLIQLSACVHRSETFSPRDDRLQTPFVVVASLAPNAQEKSGVQALTDQGFRIFAKAGMNERTRSTNAFGGSVPLPRWVQVTWREGVTPGQYWTTGSVTGDVRVEVLQRLPEELFAQVKAAPRRAIKLHFMVADDGVLLGWCIQELRPDNKLVESFHGGDFRMPP